MKKTGYSPFGGKVYVAAVLLGAVLASCTSTRSGGWQALPPPQTPAQPEALTLDEAIKEAVANIEARLEPGAKIALLNFSSPREAFSEYVLEELSGCLVNGGKLVVVDRRELDLIRREEQFQLSGEVSDESAQSIGRKLGAQFIVSGSLTGTGKVYRFRVKTLAVESAAIAATSAADINPRDGKAVSLLTGAALVAANPAGGEYTEYTITCGGDAKGFITIQQEKSGRIVITPRITEGNGSVFIDNAICPLLPPGDDGFYIDKGTKSIIIDGNTTTVTWSDGWYKTVVDGNTKTVTRSVGSWDKTVVDGNTTTVTSSNGYWYKTVVDGNTTTVTWSDGSWSKTVVDGNTKTVTSSDGFWSITVVDGNTTTLTNSYGWSFKTIVNKQGNTVSIHTESNVYN
jgi:TolB-like protein